MPITKTFITLRNFNHLLTVLVITFALYIVLLPFAPSFAWWLKHQAPVISKPTTISAAAEAPVPDKNTLQIPALGLQETVYEGATKYTLHNGVWHRPASSSPDKGGNTVLAGHRFTYHDPAVFYNLDKVGVGDPLILYWNHQRYTYKVSKILTVAPTATEVEAPTNDPTLTVYTCTPVWTSKYRLVLVAKLEGTS